MDFCYKSKYNIDDLLLIIKLLRSPDGCPWDREQTHSSIKKNFIEETYEVIEAINKNDVELLKEELGDVLLQVVFHSEMERENDSFDFGDVCNDICQKLIVRHPHVFSDTSVSSTDEVLKNWDAIKKVTKGQKNCSDSLCSVPKELPALMRAAKVQHKAVKAALDYDSSAVFDNLAKQSMALKCAVGTKAQDEIDKELGKLLFSAAAVSRACGADAEEALTAATDEYIRGVTLVERLARDKGVDIARAGKAQLDALWDEAENINMPD